MKQTSGKRGNGEGTYFTRGDKTYLRVMVGKADNGKPNYKYFSGKNRAEAKREYEKYKAQFGKLRDGSMLDWAFSDYMIFWLENDKRTAISGPTYDSIEDAWKRIQNYPVSHMKLRDLAPGAFQAMLDQMATGDGFAESTVRKTLQWVRNCLRHAFETGIIPTDPTTGVHIPRKEHFITQPKDIRSLTEEEKGKVTEAALRRYSTGKLVYRYGPVVVFLFNTGLRPEEVRGLQWKHVLEVERNGETRRSIGVCQAARQCIDREAKDGEKRRKCYLGETKTSGSERVVPLNRVAEEMLSIFREQCDGHTAPDDFVVQTENHEMTDKDNVGRCFRKILKEAGVTEGGTGINRARHTFATDLVHAGVPVSTTALLMGHSNPRTTMKYYADSDQAHAWEAVGQLEKTESSQGT